MAKRKQPNYVVGVDLGGTKILAAVVDAKGRVVGRSKRKTLPQDVTVADPPLIADRIALTVQEALSAAGINRAKIQAVGASAPGPVDVNTGWVARAANLSGWENGYDLGPELSKRLQLPVVVDNDVNLGTLGEAVYGAGRGVADLIGIFVGTGIGGGIILDGKLRRGFRWSAGEIGHMVIDVDGPVCGCGLPGHVEALASRGAFSRRLAEAMAAGERSLLAERGANEAARLSARDVASAITSGDIRAALDAGDALTLRILGEVQEVLGLLIASVVNLLDPEAIILGGGLTQSLGQPFVQAVSVAAYANFFLADPERRVKIAAAALGDDATVLGASVLARTAKQII